MQLAVLGGGVEGSPALQVVFNSGRGDRLIDGDVGLGQQEFHHVQAPFLACEEEGCRPILHAVVDARTTTIFARLEQEGDDDGVSELACHEQGRAPSYIGLVQAGPP